MSEEEKKPTANAYPESVNDQITDAAQQSNLMDVGEHPALVLGNFYQSVSQSTGIIFQNAVNNQNQQNILGQSATVQGIMQIYSLDTVSNAISNAKILSPQAKAEPTHDMHNHDDKDKK